MHGLRAFHNAANKSEVEIETTGIGVKLRCGRFGEDGTSLSSQTECTYRRLNTLAFGKAMPVR